MLRFCRKSCSGKVSGFVSGVVNQFAGGAAADTTPSNDNQQQLHNETSISGVGNTLAVSSTQGIADSCQPGDSSSKSVTVYGVTLPTPISTSFGSVARNPMSLSVIEEEKRLERRQKMFEDMVVFEGGALADHENWGRHLIFRDFIHFAQYHYKWGFHPRMIRKYAHLVTMMHFDPIPFGNLLNFPDYQNYVGRIVDSSPSYATPCTIFQPYYGWVMAEYFISVMRSKFDPSEPLVIYDIGAGTGQLALNVLDFLAEQYPDIYARCEYHAIELEPSLIPLLRRRLVHHHAHVHLHNISIVNWRVHEPRRVFVVGIELLSKLPHDGIQWTGDDLTCFEMWVRFDDKDNMSSVCEEFKPAHDPMVLRYLRYTERMKEESFHALRVLCATDGLQNILPNKHGNVIPSAFEDLPMLLQKCVWLQMDGNNAYLPTVSMLMCEVLAQYFPRHHAFFSDANHVHNGIGGENSPCAQAKIRLNKDVFVRRTVNRIIDNGGHLEISFPTNFEDFATMYKNTCGDHKETSVMIHGDFWKTFGGDKLTLFATKDGYNPLAEDFSIYSVFTSHHPQEM